MHNFQDPNAKVYYIVILELERVYLVSDSKSSDMNP